MCLRFFIVPTVISTGAATTSHSFCLKEQESVRNGHFRTKTVLLCSKSISNSINVCSADCNKVSLCRWPIELEIRRKARGRKKEKKRRTGQTLILFGWRTNWSRKWQRLQRRAHYTKASDYTGRSLHTWNHLSSWREIRKISGCRCYGDRKPSVRDDVLRGCWRVVMERMRVARTTVHFNHQSRRFLQSHWWDLLTQPGK